MDAAQALADLTEVSSQIRGAVLLDAGGGLLASTFPDTERGERVAVAAGGLLAAAEASGAGSERAQLSQVLAETGEGAVFLARSGERVVAAVTVPEPTAGLVFYDLKTCLRLAAEGGESAGAGGRGGERSPSDGEEGASEPAATEGAEDDA